MTRPRETTYDMTLTTVARLHRHIQFIVACVPGRRAWNTRNARSSCTPTGIMSQVYGNLYDHINLAVALARSSSQCDYIVQFISISPSFTLSFTRVVSGERFSRLFWLHCKPLHRDHCSSTHMNTNMNWKDGLNKLTVNDNNSIIPTTHCNLFTFLLFLYLSTTFEGSEWSRLVCISVIYSLSCSCI